MRKTLRALVVFDRRSFIAVGGLLLKSMLTSDEAPSSEISNNLKALIDTFRESLSNKGWATPIGIYDGYIDSAQKVLVAGPFELVNGAQVMLGADQRATTWNVTHYAKSKSDQLMPRGYPKNLFPSVLNELRSPTPQEVLQALGRAGQ